ncbi:MAG: FkbM family methyltransferase [Pseudomonadota bacterium]
MNFLSRLSYKYHMKHAKVLKYKGLRVPVTGPHVILPIREQLYYDDYEVPEITAISKLIRPGDRVLEIGVGLGVVSALTSKSTPDLSILAYEANPDLIVPIKELHRMNGIQNIEVVNALLEQSPEATSKPFHIHQSFAESSLIESAGSVRQVDVPTEDFGAVLDRFQPDMLVVDIEGGEAELLIGADLSRFRAVVVECHPAVLPQERIDAIHDTFRSSGLTRRTDLEMGQVVVYEVSA